MDNIKSLLQDIKPVPSCSNRNITEKFGKNSEKDSNESRYQTSSRRSRSRSGGGRSRRRGWIGISGKNPSCSRDRQRNRSRSRSRGRRSSRSPRRGKRRSSRSPRGRMGSRPRGWIGIGKNPRCWSEQKALNKTNILSESAINSSQISVKIEKPDSPIRVKIEKPDSPIRVKIEPEEDPEIHVKVENDNDLLKIPINTSQISVKTEKPDDEQYAKKHFFGKNHRAKIAEKNLPEIPVNSSRIPLISDPSTSSSQNSFPANMDFIPVNRVEKTDFNSIWTFKFKVPIPERVLSKCKPLNCQICSVTNTYLEDSKKHYLGKIHRANIVEILRNLGILCDKKGYFRNKQDIILLKQSPLPSQKKEKPRYIKREKHE